MAAPVGAYVRIYFDGFEVLCGDALRTPTGRTYVIVDRRVQARGKHAGRQHLGCVVANEPPDGERVLPIFWYRR